MAPLREHYNDFEMFEHENKFKCFGCITQLYNKFVDVLSNIPVVVGLVVLEVLGVVIVVVLVTVLI